MSVNVFKQCFAPVKEIPTWAIILIAALAVIVGVIELASDWVLATDFAQWVSHLFNVK